MSAKTYLVTNNSEGAISVVGRSRIEIPGLCKEMPLELPEKTARQTVSRLKQRYPLLKFTEVKTSQAAAPTAQTTAGENKKQTANKPSENDADKTAAASGKQENEQGATGQGQTTAGKKNK